MDFAWIEEFLATGAVLSRNRDELWVGWGGSAWMPAPDPTQLAFYAPDFFLRDADPWFHPQHWTVVRAAELLSALTGRSEPLPGIGWHTANRHHFVTIFTALHREIHHGNLQKAVPVVFDHAHCTIGPGRIAALIAGILRYIAGWPVNLYGCWDSRAGILGATPEVLFERRLLDVRTMALAGTRANCSCQGDLLASAKDRWEHELVVADVCHALNEFGTPVTESTRVLQLPTLSHLYTPIHVPLSRDRSFMEIVQRLHPTAALAGVPRDRVADWLAMIERSTPRGRFGAPFGVRTAGGESRCVVAIRNVQWENTQMQIGAGCGIVAQSELDAEWNELQLKLSAVKRILSL